MEFTTVHLKCHMMSVVLSQLFLEGIRDFPKANSIVKRNEHSLHQNKWDKVLKPQKPPKMKWPKTHIGYNNKIALQIYYVIFQVHSMIKHMAREKVRKFEHFKPISQGVKSIRSVVLRLPEKKQ